MGPQHDRPAGGLVGTATLDAHIPVLDDVQTADSVPAAEPTNWNATNTVAAGQITYLNGIRIASGATSANTPGETDFDEIRVADSWNNLLGLTAPVASSKLRAPAANWSKRVRPKRVMAAAIRG